MLLDVGLFAFGVFIGAVGTLVGVGGGFLIVPAIALLEPHWQTRTLTAYSLAVVSANACSGTAAYLRERRVDLKSVGTFIAAALPGVVIGVLGADQIPRGWFDPIFGVLLVLMAATLVFAPAWRPAGGRGGSRRAIEDARGTRYEATGKVRRPWLELTTR